MRKSLLTLTAIGALTLSLSACSGSNSSSNKASSKPTGPVEPAAHITALTGKMTQVTLDPAFLSGLKSLGLTAGTVGKATISSGGVATFPITGGSATYYPPGTVDPYVQGIIHHEGSGLSLTAGGTKVELENFDVDPGASVLTGDVLANGKTVVKGAPLFFLDGSTLKPLAMQNGDAVLEGTTVKLTKAAADLLDATYKTTAVKEGAVVGIAKITLKVPS